MKHRARLTTAVFLGAMLATLPAQGRSLATEADDSLLSIEEFTATGTLVSEVSRQFLDDDFFTRDLTEDFSNGQNFTASLVLPGSKVSESADLGRGLKHRREVGFGLRLYLTNVAGFPNDIAVSAVREGEAAAHNALVRVEPGETLGLSADVFAGYDEVRILSIQDFEAAAVLELSGAKAQEVRLDTIAPAIPLVWPSAEGLEGGFEKSINYCQSVSNYVIDITNNATGGGVLACAQRTPNGGTFYKYAIDYPTCGASFHCSTSGGSVFVNPPCQMYSNTTRRCSDSSIEHNWQNLDQVLFSCGTGTAHCVRGCTGSFTINCP